MFHYSFVFVEDTLFDWITLNPCNLEYYVFLTFVVLTVKARSCEKDIFLQARTDSLGKQRLTQDVL